MLIGSADSAVAVFSRTHEIESQGGRCIPRPMILSQATLAGGSPPIHK